MKKNAFTLIELLAVITILSLIALVVFPAINSVIKSSKNKAYNSQIATIVKAAKEYFLDNVSLLPEESEGENETVSLDTLIEEGYISQDEVIDPRNDEELTGVVQVTYNSNQYVYEYLEGNEEANYPGNWLYSNASDKDELKAQNGIYKGSNPNNYVQFNGKTWRIIKINKDNSIKLISTTYITSSWGDSVSFENIKSTLNNSITTSNVITTNWCIGQLNNECSTTVSSNVGLITTAEYVYASSDTSCDKQTGINCNKSNYLNNYPGYTLNNDGNGKIYYINDGLVTTLPSTSQRMYPVITVSKAIQVNSTTDAGTSSNPYIIS